MIATLAAAAPEGTGERGGGVEGEVTKGGRGWVGLR